MPTNVFVIFPIAFVLNFVLFYNAVRHNLWATEVTEKKRKFNSQVCLMTNADEPILHMLSRRYNLSYAKRKQLDCSTENLRTNIFP